MSWQREFTNLDVKAEALVASDGRVKSTSIDKVEGFTPFGDAPLAEATGLGLDKAGQNGEVLILTNGNSLGDTDKLAEQAEKTNAKVFVVNIENGDQANTLTDEQKLAESTGGKYWNANEASLANVADDVHETLIPAATVHEDGSDKWPIIPFAGMILLGAAGYSVRKSNGTIASLKSPQGK